MPGAYCAWQSEESPQAVDCILDKYYESRGWEKSLRLPTEQRSIELGHRNRPAVKRVRKDKTEMISGG